MIAQDACFSCLQNQVRHLCALLHISDDTHIRQKIDDILESFKTKQLMPPQIAIKVYESFRHSTNLSDPFATIKQESITKAHTIVQELLRSYPAPLLESSTDSKDSHKSLENKLSLDSIYKRLKWAVQIAILGNVIDYGSQHSFDFSHTDFSFESMEFGYFDIMPFIDTLHNASTMLYLADNAGENIFDEVLISSLKEIYPNLTIYYVLRGEPIINDLTLQDMRHPLAQGIQSHCNLLDSGVRSPGFVYEDSNMQTQNLYDNADVILAKGMGNFECLHSQNDKRLFLLFKVKCDVVATHCKVQKGKMMFIHSAKRSEAIC